MKKYMAQNGQTYNVSDDYPVTSFADAPRVRDWDDPDSLRRWDAVHNLEAKLLVLDGADHHALFNDPNMPLDALIVTHWKPNHNSNCKCEIGHLSRQPWSMAENQSSPIIPHHHHGVHRHQDANLPIKPRKNKACPMHAHLIDNPHDHYHTLVQEQANGRVQ